jgi:V/A-type H+-transporting ATPase subunit A
MKTKGKVVSIVSNMVTLEVDGPVGQNEICYIDLDGVKLMAEVIKITGDYVAVQVFESTRGLRTGCVATFEDRMLEVTLGPGMLSKIYDGLQNDLNKMEGVFLKRGDYTYALDADKKWEFTPLVKVGDELEAAGWLAEVKESWLINRIMVPFDIEGTVTVKSINEAGSYLSSDVIATVTTEDGEERELTMEIKWPVKKAVKAFAHKPRPFKLFETGVRTIDTLNPMAEGGTGFTPGPFGAGKTVLQHALAKNAEADIIVMVACGERANEVVEVFKEFPELDDPRTGRKLMERTIIIANTSNMPVAAREASVYTGMTIAEYYRSMGLKVLLLADSTSRWAQALREMSNRMEELPGQDAFPMDLSAIIAEFYSRAGYTELSGGETGSITFLGSVSPAGGNLKEPVTESTQKVARCFYSLDQERADSKRYPSIQPIDSYSKYSEYPEVMEDLNSRLQENWSELIITMKDTLLRGKEAQDQINILGDDSVPVEYHIIFNKSEVIDNVILQQDAFDDIDSSCPIERQQYMVNIVMDICEFSFDFTSFEEIGGYFKKLVNLMRQMNYQEFKNDKFNSLEKEVHELVNSRKVSFSAAEKRADEILELTEEQAAERVN